MSRMWEQGFDKGGQDTPDKAQAPEAANCQTKVVLP